MKEAEVLPFDNIQDPDSATKIMTPPSSKYSYVIKTSQC